MVKLAVPILAVVLYVPVILGHIVFTIIGCAAVVAIGSVCSCLGLWVNYRHPRRASAAIGGWTIALIVLLAIACVGAAWGGVHISDASPVTASTTVKTLAALATAAVAVGLAWILDWQSKWKGGGLAKRCLKKKFTNLFPAQPQAPPEGVSAWRVVDYAFFRAGKSDWGYGFRRDLFRAVKAAVDADGYSGGRAWKDAAPPASAPK